MLAPRKNLWSTPTLCAQQAIEMLNLTDYDIFYDIGCGDGRLLIEAASSSKSNSQIPRLIVGLDISEETCKRARENVEKAEKKHSINKNVQIEIKCFNALDYDFSHATIQSGQRTVSARPTAIFLYLIPRGLRQILPHIRNIKGLKVVTFMNAFEGVNYVRKEKVGAEPLYLYQF